MKYWLCVVNEENWNVVKKRNVWGIPEKRGRLQIEAVKPGDYLIFYVMPKRIGGIFRVVSEPFESKEKIFSWADFGRAEVFPHRVKLEPNLIANQPVSVEKLIGKLSFTKGRKHWSTSLRRAMLQIVKADYESIYALLAQK